MDSRAIKMCIRIMLASWASGHSETHGDIARSALSYLLSWIIIYPVVIMHEKKKTLPSLEHLSISTAAQWEREVKGFCPYRTRGGSQTEVAGRSLSNTMIPHLHLVSNSSHKQFMMLIFFIICLSSKSCYSYPLTSAKDGGGTPVHAGCEYPGRRRQLVPW